MATTTDREKKPHDEKDLKEKAKETADKAAEEAKKTAQTAGEKAKSGAEYVQDQSDRGVAAAGRGIEDFGKTVREKGPKEGMMGKATSAVADTLEHSGEYLEEKGLSGMAEDVTDLVRRNPIPAVLIGVGVGYMLARLTTPRS